MKASTTTNTVRCDESQSKHRAKATEDTAQNVLSVELGDVARAVAVNLPSTIVWRYRSYQKNISWQTTVNNF